MNRNISIILPCFVAAFSVMSCGEHHHAESKEEAHLDHDHGEEIVIHHEEAERFGIKTTVITPAEFHSIIPASGSIEYAPESNIMISSPVAGRLTLASQCRCRSQGSYGCRPPRIG